MGDDEVKAQYKNNSLIRGVKTHSLEDLLHAMYRHLLILLPLSLTQQTLQKVQASSTRCLQVIMGERPPDSITMKYEP